MPTSLIAANQAKSVTVEYLPAGIGWHRRTFTAPPAWSGKRVMIEFEGVYMNADVWLNGEHLGFHRRKHRRSIAPCPSAFVPPKKPAGFG